MDKLLVIEDSQSFSAILCSEIESTYAIKTVPAYSREEAENILRDNNGEFFLATIDLNLPDASGCQAVDLVLGYGVPGIVFTSELNEELRLTLLSKGVSDYVLKQGAYNIDYLIKIVGRLWRNRHLKVLVVTSDTVEGAWYKNNLTTQQVQVQCVDSPEDALQAINNNINIYVVVVDYNVLGTSAYRLVSNIRNDFADRDIRVIGVSSEDNSSSVHFLKSGADDFLRKPFPPEELFCLVNRNLDYLEHIQEFKRLNEQKQKLLGMVAHDVRGPVGNIVTAAKWLAGKDVPPQRQNAFIDLIVKSGRDVLELLNSLLDMTAISTGKVKLNCQQRPLAPLIRDRLAFFDIAAKMKGIEISTLLKSDVEAYIDDKRFSQVIDNLVSNALKFSPRRGRILIELCHSDGMSKLVVKDSGEGIPRGEERYLFSDFSRLSTKPTGGEVSTGLGLSICKSVVDAHHGEVYVDKNYQDGAAFVVLVPMSDGSSCDLGAGI
ncbi:hypothetical protein A9Q81_18385 [Gammaproteobacteria bacterium 42_54_T18]|nr:hypothetical protein A9Q81_18385 [Gammaproteobacteria bacterium 42_54_T18]